MSLVDVRSQESSLFAIEDLAGTDASPGGPPRLALSLPSSASGVVELPPDMPNDLGAATSAAVMPVAPTVAPLPATRAAWWLVGVSAAAIAGLAALVLGSEPNTVVIHQPAVASVPEMPKTDAPRTDGAPVLAAAPDLEPDLESASPPEPAPEPDQEIETSSEAKLKSKTSSRSNKSSSNTKKSSAKSKARTSKPKATTSPAKTPAKTPAQTPAKTPAKTPSTTGSTGNKGSMPSVECVLDPSKCGTTTKAAPKTPKVDPGPRPEKLSQSQLRTGLTGAKSAAKQCGRTHGAAAGAAVKVKLSIAGATGSVTKATPMGDDAGTALGVCVAGAAKKASFPTFTTSAMGVVFTFRM